MKLLSVVSLALAAVVAQATALDKRASPQGIDVSGYQPGMNWAAVKANGVQFAFIKATEGTCTPRLYPNFDTFLTVPLPIAYTNPEFSAQYTGATNNGIIRGGYHFARPDISSGAAQANFFLAHGGKFNEKIFAL